MAGTDATVRIMFGEIEIEYEGDAAFWKGELLGILKQLVELQKQNAPVVRLSEDKGDAGKAGARAGAKTNHSTDTMATILGVESGSDLVVAAAAHLPFTKRKDTFTRQEIIDEMRTAPGRFKQNVH